MNFKESDKVVCTCPARDWGVVPGCVVVYGDLPDKDVVYVVRDYAYDEFHQRDYVLLVGIECNKEPTINVEYGWDAKCFRKLEEVQAENRAVKRLNEAINKMILAIDRYKPNKP